MLAVLAVLSDIPAYFLTIIGSVTGKDMSGVIDEFNKSFKAIIEKFEEKFS